MTPYLIHHLRRRCRPLLAGLLPALLVLSSVLTAGAQSPLPSIPDSYPPSISSLRYSELPEQIDWTEPRGINIVDVVGVIPEEDLRDLIVTYSTTAGMAHYLSGERDGDTVVINVSITPRYATIGPDIFTLVGCLGQMAAYDQWPSTSPAGTVRLFANGQDVTHEIVAREMIPAGLAHPPNPSSQYYRYTFNPIEQLQSGDAPYPVPANMGCRLWVGRRLTNITATFTFTNVPQKIVATPLGKQTFLAHSYIGVGDSGNMASLNGQMGSRYGSRHDKFPLQKPDGADFILVRFAPTAVDPYGTRGDAANAGLAGSGTYRLMVGDNGFSVDHMNGMLLPLNGQWRDVDKVEESDGTTYLPYFQNINTLGSPEYFLPPGIPYDPCMTNGGCSPSLLNTIYEHVYPVEVFYYQVQRVQGSDLTRIPLKMVGSGYRPSFAGNPTPDGPRPSSAPAMGAAAVSQSTGIAQDEATAFLPMVFGEPPPPPAPKPITDPDPKDGCPCGWFDNTGRMFDFVWN